MARICVAFRSYITTCREALMLLPCAYHLRGVANTPLCLQIVGPSNEYIVNQKAVSSGDHSFDAKNDGKHLYCFSNEAWSASTKEVSFNVHGIVYVPESEAPSDPLEVEGMYYVLCTYPLRFPRVVTFSQRAQPLQTFGMMTRLADYYVLLLQ